MTPANLARRVAALAQVRCADVAVPVLSPEDDHHLRRVLRARGGEEVVVTDGAGAWAICAVEPAGLVRLTDVARDPAPAPTTLYLALVRGERGEWAVAKATEVGVARVVPLRSAHAQVPGGALPKLLARWRAAASAAAGQCRRTHDLVVADALAVGDVPDHVAVGPEGGWSPEEWGAGRRRVSLGPTVLRAETAAVVAGALVSFVAGGWGFRAAQAVGKDEASR
ncbi:MAG TPA: 16S rRNA (uracil(1498)-N(3))-methyltransferase [Acidimicrobiales bacterium]|nr:16S rRNA (uracil(1498)-N(3))-methyltransferase [Acidimicrobiales bacterium]